MREDVDKRFHHSLDWWVRETHMAWLSWIKLTCDVEINVHRKASQFILTLTIHYTSNAIIIWLQLQGNNNCDAIPLKTLCWSKRLTSFAAAGVEVEISGTLQLRLIRGQFCSEIMTNTYSIRSAVSICISRNRLVNVHFRNYDTQPFLLKYVKIALFDTQRLMWLQRSDTYTDTILRLLKPTANDSKTKTSLNLQLSKKKVHWRIIYHVVSRSTLNFWYLMKGFRSRRDSDYLASQ